jgi:CxxC motif-containing protein (DUF1111 family)
MNAHRKLFSRSLILSASLLGAAACTAPSTSDTPEATDPGVTVATQEEGSGVHTNAVTEAPTGFTGATNGFIPQADMDGARAAFEAAEVFADGIGPVFNNISCVSCHGNPFFGNGASQITELRAGHFNGTSFVDHPGGSLINDRATDRSIQEHILSGNEVRTLRLTLATNGDGFVESVDSNTLVAISNNQPAAQRGTVIQVAVLESGGAVRVGRFGWKNQNASLLSFAADAYLNEMGITNRLLDTENTSNGTVVQGGPFDGKGDPRGVGEDDENDIDEFADFMRAQKAPPRGPINAQVTAGQTTFTQIGCAVCHVATITTAPAGTVINAGAFTVPTSLGDKNIHPISDYLLHNIGTGDGIVQNGGQGTRNQVRTAPLWGIGARTRFMHDGASVTVSDAIGRHNGQATTARQNFQALSAASQANVLAFIFSL